MIAAVASLTVVSTAFVQAGVFELEVGDHQLLLLHGHRRASLGNGAVDFPPDHARRWQAAEDALQREFVAAKEDFVRLGRPQLDRTAVVRIGLDHLNLRERTATDDVQLARENVADELLLLIFVFDVQKVQIACNAFRTLSDFVRRTDRSLTVVILLNAWIGDEKAELIARVRIIRPVRFRVGHARRWLARNLQRITATHLNHLCLVVDGKGAQLSQSHANFARHRRAPHVRRIALVPALIDGLRLCEDQRARIAGHGHAIVLRARLVESTVSRPRVDRRRTAPGQARQFDVHTRVKDHFGIGFSDNGRGHGN